MSYAMKGGVRVSAVSEEERVAVGAIATKGSLEQQAAVDVHYRSELERACRSRLIRLDDVEVNGLTGSRLRRGHGDLGRVDGLSAAAELVPGVGCMEVEEGALARGGKTVSSCEEDMPSARDLLGKPCDLLVVVVHKSGVDEGEARRTRRGGAVAEVEGGAFGVPPLAEG
eukprot:765180-Hanusia_phi.AAC.3